MIVKRILATAQNVFTANRQNLMFGNAMRKNTILTQNLVGNQNESQKKTKLEEIL